MNVSLVRHPRLLMLLALAGCSRTSTTTAPPPVAADQTWAFYGADEGGQRFSPAAQVTPANVAELKPAWRFSTGDMASRGQEMKHASFENTPIMAGGRVYVCSPFNEVFALDPGTGARLWSYDPRIDPTVRYPNRTRALILSRASWLAEPLPPNLAVFPKIAGLIREHGAHRAKELFASTAEYQTALQSSPANAASLMAQFLRERADETFEILESRPNDVPAPDIASWKKMDFPTLVLACRNNPLHPFEYGQALAREIPGARFAEITAKAISGQKHVENVRREILRFIGEIESTIRAQRVDVRVLLQQQVVGIGTLVDRALERLGLAIRDRPEPPRVDHAATTSGPRTPV